MTPDRASTIIASLAFAGFVFVFAFNLGRLTNGKVEIKCAAQTYTIPFKGTLP